MLFVGDVAIGTSDSVSYKNFPQEFFKETICVNLEGAVCDGTSSLYGTYNCKTWMRAFNKFPDIVCFLGNNHICDIPCGLENTISVLEKRGIRHFGAGANSIDATRILVYEDFVLLGFGWDVIGCRSARIDCSGVNRLTERNVKDQVAHAVKCFPNKKIIVVFHWNYEFELYPQPGHRRLAHDVIDMGIHAVIGHHSHLASHIEHYKNKLIVYGLGNWIFSYGCFFNKKLKFPPSSFTQLALRLHDNCANDVLYKVKFSPEENQLEFCAQNSPHDGDLWCKADFNGLSQKEYAKWFKLNRKKTKLLPIYFSADENIENSLKDYWNGMRQTFIDLAVKTGLKSTKRSN